MELSNKRVFLRADLNVPLKNGTILEDFRLQQLRPTLDYLHKHGARVLIGTHLGRPKDLELDLSTQVLCQWFNEHGYKVEFAATIEQAQKMIQEHTIVLLENLRFFPGELQPNKEFAQQLKSLADIYVTDAFGTLHRSNCSIARLPLLFEERTIGFLIEKELAALNKLLKPEKPFLMILGGGKVQDKIPFIKNLLPFIDTIALCPAIVFSFLQAFHYEVGRSLVDDKSVQEICNLAQLAQEHHTQLFLPPDFLVEQHGEFSVVSIGNFPKDAIGWSIGPETCAGWQEMIARAGTIFINGLPGQLSRPETLQYYNQLLQQVANAKAYTVIGGGDSVGAILQLNLENKVDYLSTGGGAALAYLGGEELPGLVPFI